MSKLYNMLSLMLIPLHRLIVFGMRDDECVDHIFMSKLSKMLSLMLILLHLLVVFGM